MSGITTHVLDTSRGKPAAGVRVVLTRLGVEGEDEGPAIEALTDDDGRVSAHVAGPAEAGTYRLTFDTGAYFSARGVDCFYPEITVTFDVHDPGQHYHVPLLVSPFGYSTYRGS